MPPELTFDTLDYRVYRGSLLTAEGRATRASFRRDTSDLTGEDVTVRFPATPSHAEARIAAARAAGNVREHRFQASGGVRALQGDQVATTEEARYRAADGLVRGDRPVEVRGGSRFVLRGPGFTLDPQDQVLRVEGGAQVVAGGAGR